MVGKIGAAGIFALALFTSSGAGAEGTKFSVYFYKGSADVSPEANAVLQEVVQFANSPGGEKVDIIGHSDPSDVSDGADAAQLSAARAQAVSDALRADGLPTADAIAVSSVGTNNPVDPAGGPLNRVAEIVVY